MNTDYNKGFTVLQMETWNRREHYLHYMNDARCSYSLTADVDITSLLAASTEMGLSFYPVELYMLSSAVNRHPAFRMDRNDKGELGYWENMHPSYTVFHREQETFSSVWTPFHPDFADFYRAYSADKAKYGETLAFAPKPDEPPNTFCISAVPWVAFHDFHLHLYDDGNYLKPIFTTGGYRRQASAAGERVFLPVSVQVHHSVCDGYHVGMFFRDLEEMANSHEEWLLL